MRDKETKYFADPNGICDADSASFAVAINSWINMVNCRTGSTDKGSTEIVESIGSSLLLSAPQPSVNYLQNGWAEDTENNRLLRFMKNTTGIQDKIECWDEDAGVLYTVLLSSQIEGGLNLDKNHYIHSARVVNGLLYWTDNNEEPKKINIDSGIKLNNPSYVTTQPAYPALLPDSYEITLIRRPPTYSPSIAKDTDSGFVNNFIQFSSFLFTWQYGYYDGEFSTLSEFSTASKINSTFETYNFIRVTLSNLETIPETARFLRLVAFNQNTLEAYTIKTWDKVVDDTPFINHNNGSSQISFSWYGNTTGETIAPYIVSKPFDSVPLLSETLEVAGDRIFLGNNLVGYNTPGTTSLEVSATTVTPGANIVTQLLWLELGATDEPMLGNFYLGEYMVYLDSVTPAGYYYIPGTKEESTVSQPTPTMPYPTTDDYTDLPYMGLFLTDVANYWAFRSPTGGYNEQNFQDTLQTFTVTGLDASVAATFKGSGDYGPGIVFYDKALRKCGVVTDHGIIVSIPPRNYAGSISYLLSWTLSNGDAVNEIPDWAYYYAPVITLNQKTRFFIESYSNSLKYATKDADGNYVFSNTTFGTTTVGIGVDTTQLVQSKLGYVFTENDVCVLIKSDNTRYEIPVIGQDGKYIILKAQDIGDVTTAQWIYEIYTPYKINTNEAYYERGQLYPILNPGTANRQYSTLSGTYTGDIFYLTRVFNGTFYDVEAMNPNDDYYQLWNTDAGRANFVTLLGQVRIEGQIAWSGTYIPGTQTNNLSSFEALNVRIMPLECGGVQKLQLTSKVQDEQGVVMLAICVMETASLYLGEVQTYGANREATLIVSDNVIGTVNVLKGSRGTTNPESVTEYRGLVFWANASNGRYCQYSAGGIFDISDYKFVRFWKNWFLQFNSMTVAEIEALGGRPYLFSIVDPSHGELLISIPKLSNTPPKGYLPDYPNTIYPFDILDFQAKTIVYKLQNGSTPPHWQGSYTMNPECLMVLQNKLFVSNYGHLYLMNQPVTNGINLFGVVYSAKIMFLSNKDAILPKEYDRVSVESNIVPNFIYLYNDYPIQQSSDIVDEDFRPFEGIWDARIFRNKLVPTATGYTTDGLLTAEKMRNVAMYIMAEWRITTTPLALKFFTIAVEISRGHQKP